MGRSYTSDAFEKDTAMNVRDSNGTPLSEGDSVTEGQIVLLFEPS